MKTATHKKVATTEKTPKKHTHTQLHEKSHTHMYSLYIKFRIAQLKINSRSNKQSKRGYLAWNFTFQAGFEAMKLQFRKKFWFRVWGGRRERERRQNFVSNKLIWQIDAVKPFPVQEVPHWRVKSSGVRQSKIYKCPERSFGREGVNMNIMNKIIIYTRL